MSLSISSCSSKLIYLSEYMVWFLPVKTNNSMTDDCIKSTAREMWLILNFFQQIWKISKIKKHKNCYSSGKHFWNTLDVLSQISQIYLFIYWFYLLDCYVKNICHSPTLVYKLSYFKKSLLLPPFNIAFYHCKSLILRNKYS